ncbi:DNA replication/repair protein RecF [Parasphingorhabdus sp. DH2-15]|uniref:DNA replication/repair protein RecF n=1 Tax=Parasphingorhabdus sp. DH2-15 TaxID=3444112 RepID=UPI003F688C64
MPIAKDMNNAFHALMTLSLTDFRNHAASQLDGLAQLNVLTGDNGAGKTNILEALSLLSHGRGMRSAANNEIARRDGAGGFAVSASLGSAAGPVKLGTGMHVKHPGRRLVRINGSQASQNILGEYLTVNWLTPAHDRLFVETAGARRRYLDRLTAAIRPGHLGYVQQYEAAMRERNRLLSDERLNGKMMDPLWFDALESRMERYAAAIESGRRELVEQLETMFDETHNGGFAKPCLSIVSRSEYLKNGTERPLTEVWRSARARDRAAGRTLDGPHRDDMHVVMRQTGEAAASCSTGQQKAMLIALTLTHSELVAERRPRLPALLLLDEVAAHLDASRRASLFEQLSQRNMQVWMTGTDASLFAALPDHGRFIQVETGRIVSAFSG